MSRFVRRTPEGDNRERTVCADCGYVAYENPKVVVGSVVVADGRVLMCRRAIERPARHASSAGSIELPTERSGAMKQIIRRVPVISGDFFARLHGAALVLALVGLSPAMAEPLPVPPVPPANPPPGDVAPIPDLYAQAPVAPISETPRFDVRLYRARPYEPGLGFAPGSRYQDSEERKPIQTPGISIRVPLN